VHALLFGCGYEALGVEIEGEDLGFSRCCLGCHFVPSVEGLLTADVSYSLEERVLAAARVAWED
jgi:hypothetical protein